MTIDSITINLKDKEPIEFTKTTDFTPFILREGEYIITTVEINYNGENVTIIATPTERDEDELEELIETLYELFDYDLAELYEQLPSVAQENLSVSEWMPHDEEFYNLYFSEEPARAVRAAIFGDVHWADDYVRFNGYGNLETASCIPYDDEADVIIREWIYDKTDIQQDILYGIFRKESQMNNILDHIKPLVDGIYKREPEFDNDIVVQPDVIIIKETGRFPGYYIITLNENGLFNIVADYDDGIMKVDLETIEQVVDFILE